MGHVIFPFIRITKINIKCQFGEYKNFREL